MVIILKGNTFTVERQRSDRSDLLEAAAGALTTNFAVDPAHIKHGRSIAGRPQIRVAFPTRKAANDVYKWFDKKFNYRP